MELNDFIGKASHTDIITAGKNNQVNYLKHTEKPKAHLLQRQSETSGDPAACASHKEILGNESFSFEKEKLQQLMIENAPPMDVNDESITKLKVEIFKRFQEVLNKFERLSNIARIVTVALLFIEILEMIGMFFTLLYLSMKMVPTEQILFWVGSSLVLSLVQTFILIKGIVASQSKEIKTHKEYLHIGIIFFILLIIAVIVYIKGISSSDELFGESLTNNAKSTLRIAQILMFVQTIIKALFQVSFFFIECLQIKNLHLMNRNKIPSADPPSQNYILENLGMEKIN